MAKRSVPFKGLLEWVNRSDSKKKRVVSKTFCSEALIPECSFSRKAGECAERVMKMDLPFKLPISGQHIEREG